MLFCKVQIDKIYHFIVVWVICLYNFGKEIVQSCQAAKFVSAAMFRVAYEVVHFQVWD